MGTFHRSAEHIMASVADAIDAIDDGSIDVHTVTLILNGQHGEFDLRVEATDDDMEERVWTGVAYRTGGVRDFGEVDPR
jgi:hypothetical protein